MTTMTGQPVVKLLEVLPNQELLKDLALDLAMRPLPPLRTPTMEVCADDTSKTLQVHII